MKVAVLCGIFAIAASSPSRLLSSGNIVQEIKNYGYPINTYEVTTGDGYILDLFRMPHGLLNKNKNHQSDDEVRPAVLLMSGMYSDAIDFVMGGPTQGLAYVLADHGYDVFMGNVRGSIFGQRHTTLDPTKDAAFWKFCWHEMGVRDLPAIADKVLEVANQKKLIHVGHNEGSTSFYVMTSEMPEYNDKIERHISLGPVVFMKDAKSAVIDNIVQNLDSQQWIVKNVGMNTFMPSQELVQTAYDDCAAKKVDENICKNVYFLLNGYNSEHLNQTTVKVLLERLPATGSAREILHYAVLKSTGHFQKYSEDSTTGDYDLSKISTPVAVFYTPEDPLAQESDVKTLIGKLEHVSEVRFDGLSNNLDLLYSKNVYSVVYEKILEAMKMDIKKYHKN